MKYLVPVARVNAEDCTRMAAAFVAHHCNTRQAGQLYTAWRQGTRAVRERILAEPELFLKTQRQAPAARPAAVEQVERDLEMAIAILRRTGRRLAEALPEMTGAQQKQAQGQLENARRELHRMAERIGKEQEMYASLADRSTRQLLNRLARLDVLLIDEFGYLNLKPEQSNTFFKLMEERYTRHSTIITTNLRYDEWQNFLGNKSMVDALLSRVRHYCHTVTINGPSLREPQG
ncbi:MAG: ATP-binding protein [Bryobacteraceae bacterium]